ncbi:hypothetical protein HNQ51_002497 [Inhella inkyongensis]|uniref:DUF1579 domain-containing protein n=1 Tax=Inhella inkyongensis TaxID=392593 RepID=A0A840S6P1_9BURK|nr:DUF1579 domain-containing protein [Inhella inkyongensis]MBB5205178.1 hypothetical protein [Inhella inkyongensis]
MTPHAPNTPQHDFDFFFGQWQVRHRRLRERLKGCQDWDEFDGRCSAQPLLGGQGNIDDNWLDLPAGAYRAVTLRAFDPSSGLWAIWWLDARRPHGLDVPVRGGFDANREGLFYADDELDDRPIRVRFRWHDIQADSCRWEQAFSVDGGADSEAQWEVNWTMEFTRV